MSNAKRWIKLYTRAWREGLRKQLLAGNVALSHVVDGERVELDPEHYRALECYPPPITAAHTNPTFVLGDKPLHSVLIHPLTAAARAKMASE